MAVGQAEGSKTTSTGCWARRNYPWRTLLFSFLLRRLDCAGPIGRRLLPPIIILLIVAGTTKKSSPKAFLFFGFGLRSRCGVGRNQRRLTGNPGRAPS